MHTTIVTIILAAIGLSILPFFLKAVALALWEIIEIPFRIVMIVVYAIAYLAITLWEALVWLIRLPLKIARWVISRFQDQ